MRMKIFFSFCLRNGSVIQRIFIVLHISMSSGAEGSPREKLSVWVSLKDRIPIRILGTRSSRRLSVLSMFNSGGEEENGTAVFFFRTLSMMGGIGIFAGGFILFLLVGSVALILY